MGTKPENLYELWQSMHNTAQIGIKPELWFSNPTWNTTTLNIFMLWESFWTNSCRKDITSVELGSGARGLRNYFCTLILLVSVWTVELASKCGSRSQTTVAIIKLKQMTNGTVNITRISYEFWAFLCPQVSAGSHVKVCHQPSSWTSKYLIMWVPTHHVMPNGVKSMLTVLWIFLWR